MYPLCSMWIWDYNFAPFQWKLHVLSHWLMHCSLKQSNVYDWLFHQEEGGSHDTGHGDIIDKVWGSFTNHHPRSPMPSSLSTSHHTHLWKSGGGTGDFGGWRICSQLQMGLQMHPTGGLDVGSVHGVDDGVGHSPWLSNSGIMLVLTFKLMVASAPHRWQFRCSSWCGW